jgi:hypothetical protein
MNGYKANNVQIINNTFSNMSDRVAAEDMYNCCGNAGILILPRRNNEQSLDAVVAKTHL